jgi:hypothetical protein
MYIIIWIILCFVIAWFGEDRRVGFWGAFFWSLLLSPLIGAIITFTSERKDDIVYKEQVLETAQKQERIIQQIKDSQSRPSKADEIKELKKLFDEGTLTQEEFDKGKKSILSRMG